jgi:hypothetical protein
MMEENARVHGSGISWWAAGSRSAIQKDMVVRVAGSTREAAARVFGIKSAGGKLSSGEEPPAGGSWGGPTRCLKLGSKRASVTPCSQRLIGFASTPSLILQDFMAKMDMDCFFIDFIATL